MFKYKLPILFVLISLIFACTSKEHALLSIRFSADSSTILFSNIQPASILQLKSNIKTDTMYQKIVSVLETPSDDDSTSMERIWSGRLSMQGDALVFTPDSPFVKGKTYLVETQLNMSFGDFEQVIQGKMSKTMNFQQQLLKR
jgi:hypothetical protein